MTSGACPVAAYMRALALQSALLDLIPHGTSGEFQYVKRSVHGSIERDDTSQDCCKLLVLSDMKYNVFVLSVDKVTITPDDSACPLVPANTIAKIKVVL